MIKLEEHIMKKLILLLLFIPLVSFGQEQTQATVIQQYTTNESSTNIENELVLSNEETTIKTPLIIDLNNYTHLCLVRVNIKGRYGFIDSSYSLAERNKYAYAPVQNLLSMGLLQVVNPYKFDAKRFRKDPLYLRTIKKDTYLYLYLNQAAGRGDDVNTTILIRDWKNKIIYNATHINTGLNEILAPLIDY